MGNKISQSIGASYKLVLMDLVSGYIIKRKENLWSVEDIGGDNEATRLGAS